MCLKLPFDGDPHASDPPIHHILALPGKRICCMTSFSWASATVPSRAIISRRRPQPPLRNGLMRLILHQHSIKFQTKLDSLLPSQKVENVQPSVAPRPSSLGSPGRPGWFLNSRMSIDFPQDLSSLFTWAANPPSLTGPRPLYPSFIVGFYQYGWIRNLRRQSGRSQFIAEQETSSL